MLVYIFIRKRNSEGNYIGLYSMFEWKLLKVILFWKTEPAIQGHTLLCECSSEGNGIKLFKLLLY